MFISLYLYFVLDLRGDTFQPWRLLPVVTFSVGCGRARAGKALAANQATGRPRPWKGMFVHIGKLDRPSR